MKKRWGAVLALLIVLLIGTAVPAQAKWVTSGSTKKWVAKNGTIRESRYYAKEGLGFVRIGEYWVCYNSSNIRVKGLVTVNGKDTYYFNPSRRGRMAIRQTIKLNGNYYRFCKTGKMLRNIWYAKRYYNAKGVMVRNCFVGKRYVGSGYRWVSGLQKIKGCCYYFNESNGYYVTNTTKKVKGVLYKFDSKGHGSVVSENSLAVESQYYTDPEVSDETLLAAIICCEAGNQPAAGKRAVGLVIINRMRKSGFPSTMREVVYAYHQFAPVRQGILSKYVKNPSTIPTACKNAAKLVLKKYRNGNFNLQISTNPKKTVYFGDYVFFMTPAAYKTLGLSSATVTIGDHVFFKSWV